jgi:hypothetical protein
MTTRALRRIFARPIARVAPVGAAHAVRAAAGGSGGEDARAAERARDRERARQEGTWLDYGCRT